MILKAMNCLFKMIHLSKLFHVEHVCFFSVTNCLFHVKHFYLACSKYLIVYRMLIPLLLYIFFYVSIVFL